MLGKNYSKRFDREYKQFLRSGGGAADRIDRLVADVLAHPTTGMGDPERLHPKEFEYVVAAH